MDVTPVAIDDLRPDPLNARKHSADNLTAIARSLDEFGQRRAIVIDDAGTILAGHGVWEAAKSLGWTNVDVTVAPGEWSAEQRRAFALADNRTGDLSTWNDEALLESLEMLDGDALLEAAGFSVDDLDDLRAEIEEAEPETETDGKGHHGERYTPSLSDYAERYASKTTRFIALDYPNEIYLWVVDRLTEQREEMGLTSNAETVLRILEAHCEMEAPEWT